MTLFDHHVHTERSDGPTFSPLAATGDPEAAFPVEWQERLIQLCRAARVALEANESYRVAHDRFLTGRKVRQAGRSTARSS